MKKGTMSAEALADVRKWMRWSKWIVCGSLLLTFGGMLVGALCKSMVLVWVFAILGLPVAFSGVYAGWSHVRCPCCGESWMLGGCLPAELPRFCPCCGEPSGAAADGEREEKK